MYKYVEDLKMSTRKNISPSFVLWGFTILSVACGTGGTIGSYFAYKGSTLNEVFENAKPTAQDICITRIFTDNAIQVSPSSENTAHPITNVETSIANNEALLEECSEELAKEAVRKHRYENRFLPIAGSGGFIATGLLIFLLSHLRKSDPLPPKRGMLSPRLEVTS